MKLAQIRPPKGEPGDPGGLQAISKGNSGKTGKKAAKKQNTPTTTVCVATTTIQRHGCEDCQTYVPAGATTKAYTFCCPIRVQSIVAVK